MKTLTITLNCNANAKVTVTVQKVVTPKGTVFTASLANKAYQSTSYDRLVSQLRAVASGA